MSRIFGEVRQNGYGRKGKTFEMIAEAASRWDGSDPIRTIGN